MKFRKKSWLAFLLMVVISLVLTACGGGNDDKAKKDDSGDDGGGKKITIFQSKVEISDQLEALAKEYEKETGIKVEIKCLWKFTFYYCRFCYFYRHFIVDDCMDVGKNE